MTTEGLTFVKNDNCFTWVNDFEKAATILKKQTQECWPKTLDVIMEIINPIQHRLFTNGNGYYWTIHQSEWATDIIFKNNRADFVRSHQLSVFSHQLLGIFPKKADS